MRFKNLISTCIAAAMLITLPVFAGPKEKSGKTYDEQTFLSMVGNKSKKQVVEMFGEPAKKQVSVKPSNAQGVVSGMVGRPLDESSKPVNVEMWYYTNLVRYEAKKTYKTTELTFVNGRCANTAFFNTP